MEKLIITAAICGAEVTKNQNPNIPYTVEEIKNEAISAYNAGASIIHLHVREDDGTPTQSVDRFRECIREIKSKCPDIIILPSTGGAVGMSDEARLQPLMLKPEIATLDCGTCNFGKKDIFVNTEESIRNFAMVMKTSNIKPEIEVFDKGMIDTALRLAKDGYFKEKLHFNFAMGLIGGIGAEITDLAFMISSIPYDATYTVTGIGKHEFTIATMGIAAGGHVRVGFEDNIYIEKGKLAKSNGELVGKVVRIARELGRAIATPAEARAILHLKE